MTNTAPQCRFCPDGCAMTALPPNWSQRGLKYLFLTKPAKIKERATAGDFESLQRFMHQQFKAMNVQENKEMLGFFLDRCRNFCFELKSYRKRVKSVPEISKALGEFLNPNQNG